MSTPEYPHLVRDPREQAVMADDHEAIYHLPIPLVTDPVTVPAVSVRDDVCAACGAIRDLHYDTSQIFWIGCAGATRRIELGLVEPGPQREPVEHVSRDQQPVVSKAITAALMTSLGTLTGVFVELRQDEQHAIARHLAIVAVRAYIERGPHE